MTGLTNWFAKFDHSSVTISRILSGGIWPALPLTGYWLMTADLLETSDSPFPGFTRFALWTTAGIVVWSVGLLLAAAGRVYRASDFGLAGWAVVLVSLLALIRSGDLTWIWVPSTAWDGVLAAGLLLAAALYLGFPRETILEGGDMAVYANHGIFIAQHGRLDLPYPWQGADPALANALTEHSAHKSIFFQNHVFLGFQKNGPRLAAEFGHIWPMWLAQAFATAGPAALFRLNGVLALLAVGAFHGVCLTAMPAPMSVVATVFLALVPSQVWIARTTLSEVFTQLASCAGLLLLLQALKTGAPAMALWAGAFLSFAALIRCDSFLLLPLALIAQLGQSLLAQPADRFDHVWLSFGQTAGPGFLLATAYYLGFSRPYFWKQFFYLRLIGLGTAVAGAAHFILPPLLRAAAFPWLTAETVANLVGIGAILLAAYAYWIRPAVVHYRIDWPDYPLHGKNYRAEYSLRDLGRYLSPVVLGAAVVGGWLALRATMGSTNPWLLPWLIIAAGYAVLYLYDPYDDPGHIFRIRRYVPIIIPGFLFFAAVTGAYGLDRVPGVWQGTVTAALLVSLVGFAAWRGAAFWWRAEDLGAWAQLRSLAELVPNETLIFAAGRPEWMTPLYVTYDRRIVPLDLDQDAGWEILARGVADQTQRGKPAYLLYDNGPLLFSQQPQEVGRVVLSRRFLERTDEPVPRRFEGIQMTVVLAAIHGPLERPNPHKCALGGSKVWGVEESGFYEEYDEAGFVDTRMRWTNGHAKLVIPTAEGNWPGRLMIDLASVSPTDSQLRVLANGQELRNGFVPGGRNWFEILSLANVPIDCVLTLEMISNTFVPSQIFEDSKDDRRLGVRVRAVRLLPSIRRHPHPKIRNAPEPKATILGAEPEDSADGTQRSIQGLEGPSRASSSLRSTHLRRKPKPTIAFFSPLLPQKSGVADYSALLLEELKKYYSIDLFHDSGYIPETALANHEFLSCDYRLFNRVASAKSYHAIVYQMGNSPYHSYMYNTMIQHPGLVTLHDFCLPGFHLHYGESLGLGESYIADELRRWYPEDREAIEDTLATWPMGWDFARECVRRGWHLNRRILEAAQVMVVHSPWCVRETENGTPHQAGKLVVIRHGIHPRAASLAERIAVRDHFRLPQDARIFGSFGFMNADKMNMPSLDAFAVIAKEDTSSLFIFVGEEEDGGEARNHAAALGISHRVRIFGRQPADAFSALIRATDVGVNLRRPPTNGETSGTLLNLLAAGIPTLVNDVATFSDYPASVVRKVVWETEGQAGLVCAMSALSGNPEDRTLLGKAALNYVTQSHNWLEVGEQYVDAIERCHQELRESRHDGRRSRPCVRPSHEASNTATRSVH